jgi:hypothetical protein
MKLTLNKLKEEGYNNENPKSEWNKLLKFLNKTEADDTEVSINNLLEIYDVYTVLYIIRNYIEGELDKKRNMIDDFLQPMLCIWDDWVKDKYTRFESWGLDFQEYCYIPRNITYVYKNDNTSDEERISASNKITQMLEKMEEHSIYTPPYVSKALHSIQNANWSSQINIGFLLSDIEIAMRYYSYPFAWKAQVERQKQIILKYFSE